MELQLIELYVWICLVYDKHPGLKYQRLSNNWQPDFTDQELLTVYLFGHLQGQFEQKRIYNYIKQHFSAWFPRLPSYQAFNQRMNEAAAVFEVLIFELLNGWQALPDYFGEVIINEDCVIDSLPIMLAVRGRSGRARVASQLADVGYCASKQMYYHGVKLHVLGRKRIAQLPRPETITMSAASVHDLPILEELHGTVWGNLFADKAYQDRWTTQEFEKQGVILCTPDKKRKNTQVYEVGKSGLWSRFVSAMKQPIESFFNWINEQTAIQNGSKIRSMAGLLVHCYGKLTAALFILRFNP